MGRLQGVETLAAVTGDAFRSSRLDRMMSSFRASYKLYWLRGVFDEALAGVDVVPMRRLAARMVALAWYPVTFFRLDLGATDRLGQAVDRAHHVCTLRDGATENQIREAVLNSHDPELRQRLDNLCNYVPQRLIRPFYAERISAERKRRNISNDRFDHYVNQLIVDYNREDRAGAPYSFVDDGKAIEIDHDWAVYFRDNRHVLEGWLDMRLVDYLQARNPSVPAIPLKIHPPQHRKLNSARRWWLDALADHEFREIYSGTAFTSEAFEAHGPMSVDHFIPWSFVLHDEPWNLVPLFRDTNSSKGNQLPDIDVYLQPFCAQQFDAVVTLRGRGHGKVFDDYTAVDPQVMLYERTDAAREAFTQAVSRVVKPLWQIASNQGFEVWAG